MRRQQGSPPCLIATVLLLVLTLPRPACSVCLPPSCLSAARGKGSKQESPQASRTPSEESSLANSRHTYASTEGKAPSTHVALRCAVPVDLPVGLPVVPCLGPSLRSGLPWPTVSSSVSLSACRGHFRSARGRWRSSSASGRSSRRGARLAGHQPLALPAAGGRDPAGGRRSAGGGGGAGFATRHAPAAARVPVAAPGCPAAARTCFGGTRLRCCSSSSGSSGSSGGACSRRAAGATAAAAAAGGQQRLPRGGRCC